MLGTTLILTGVALIAGAIIGGGVKLLQVEFKEIPSLSRQLLLGSFGFILVIAGLVVDGRLSLPASANNSASVAPPASNSSAAVTPTTQSPSNSVVSVTPKEAETTAANAERTPEQPATSEVAQQRATTVLTPGDLKSALRLQVGDPTGSAVGGASVRPVRIWLELPEPERQLVQAVRYEFNDPSFRSPKYAERGSSTFTARWAGYGCINDATVIARTTAGDVSAPFDLCALWEHGRL